MLAPGGAVPGAHVHPEQEESFEVTSGTMAFRLGLKRIVAGPGETVVSLAQEGRCLRSGMPRPLDLALFVREFRREVRAPFPPPLAVRAALAPLAWVAERRGRDLQPAELTPSFA